ncbi:hypothetical protein PybrP1_005368 [[Pythium] brassicae (nom. inval.)]|nr:hypothetical protein PybrP1_005368 [[Pythium] brassicae (nom. inval.)]
MDEHDAPTMSISVGPAGKVGDGVNAYYVYTVTSAPINAPSTTTTTKPTETEPTKDKDAAASAQVDRRYSDFLWLHNQLSKQCAGFIIPPLPAKVVGILQGPEFREDRRAGLERFLRKVVMHDELKNTEFFKSFIECTPVELTAVKAKTQAAMLSPPSLAAVAQKTQAINSWWGKAMQRITENDHFKMLAAKAGHDVVNNETIEDPGFEELIKYVRELHTQVRVLKVKIHAADQQNKLTAGAYCDLIECLHGIADTEAAYSEVPTSDFSAVLKLLDTRARQTDSELERFGLAVKNFSRWMHAVKIAISVREDRRLHYQSKLAAKAKETSKNTGFETPTAESPTSSKTGGVTSAPIPNKNLHEEVEAARVEFEKVHARVVSEIARFRADKSAELRHMFAEFAALQVRNSAELTEALNASMVQLKSPLPSRLMFSNSSRFLSQSTFSDENNQAEDENEASALLHKMRVRPVATDSAAKPDAYADVRL